MEIENLPQNNTNELSSFSELINIFSHGGTEAIITLLVLVIAFFLYERKTLNAAAHQAYIDLIKSKDAEKQTLLEINNKYHDSTMIQVAAMHELKIVLENVRDKKG